jgi:hemin uptake protein HemP
VRPDRIKPDPLMPGGVGAGSASTVGTPVIGGSPTRLPHSKARASAPREPISSDALFGGAREVEISHGGVLYRLKQTALGKLILTK